MSDQIGVTERTLGQLVAEGALGHADLIAHRPSARVVCPTTLPSAGRAPSLYSVQAGFEGFQKPRDRPELSKGSAHGRHWVGSWADNSSGGSMSDQNGATERTLGQLVADATHDLSSIIRSEIALAKAEIGADAKKAGAGAGLFAAAALLVFLALILLPIAAAYGLVAAGLAPWLSFLVVSGVFLMLGAILAVSYTHLRAHETGRNLVCRLLLE